MIPIILISFWNFQTPVSEFGKMCPKNSANIIPDKNPPRCPIVSTLFVDEDDKADKFKSRDKNRKMKIQYFWSGALSRVFQFIIKYEAYID